MKKIILFVLILSCLAFTFVGCKGDGDVEETTAATTVDPNHAHEWGEVEVTEAPDCRYAGEGKKTCALCGAVEKVEIPALGHDVPTSSYVDNPTFTRGGVASGVCTRCEKKIRSDAPALKKEYVAISANIASVNNVYFNGFWTNTQNGAFTNMLGSEVMAKVKGASKVTYTFEVSDTTKSAVVAYTTDGINWTRQDLKTSATLTVTVPADETVVRVMFVDTALDMAQAGTGITLKSVAADKGTVAPCAKKGINVLVISDNVTDIEKDVFTLAAESLGVNAYRMSRKGFGYESLSAFLENYAAEGNTTAVNPAYIMISLGENEANLAGNIFMVAISDVMNALMEAYAETDILLVKPESGAKAGMLDTIASYHGCVSIVETSEWATAEDINEKSEMLEKTLVDIYGEKVYFDGYYEKYTAPDVSTFPNDKTGNGSYGELKPMEKV
ncbi:MAG: hypothetical protein J6A83_01600 [Clostridia bacterium]|nr:hypothetical protein [Clostridia bacterium]